jgi:hypothetical protein
MPGQFPQSFQWFCNVLTYLKRYIECQFDFILIARLHTYLAFCVSQLWSFIVIYLQLNDHQMTIE